MCKKSTFQLKSGNSEAMPSQAIPVWSARACLHCHEPACWAWSEAQAEGCSSHCISCLEITVDLSVKNTGGDVLFKTGHYLETRQHSLNYLSCYSTQDPVILNRSCPLHLLITLQIRLIVWLSNRFSVVALNSVNYNSARWVAEKGTKSKFLQKVKGKEMSSCFPCNKC